jgi:hypothetical protein
MDGLVVDILLCICDVIEGERKRDEYIIQCKQVPASRNSSFDMYGRRCNRRSAISDVTL